MKNFYVHKNSSAGTTLLFSEGKLLQIPAFAITKNSLEEIINLNVFEEYYKIPVLEIGKKISKRDGSGLVSDYADYNTEAILNWIFKMGWSHKDSTFDKQYPTLNINQMIEVFNGGNINQSNTKVFKDKLDWLNKKFNRK